MLRADWKEAVYASEASDQHDNSSDGEEDGLLSVDRVEEQGSSLPRRQILRQIGEEVTGSSVKLTETGQSTKTQPKKTKVRQIRHFYKDFLDEEGDVDQSQDEKLDRYEEESTSGDSGGDFSDEDEVLDDSRTISTGNQQEPYAEEERDGIVAQIQELQRQLMEARQLEDETTQTRAAVVASSKDNDLSTADTVKEIPYKSPAALHVADSPVFVTKPNKIIVCAVERPVTIVRSKQGDGWLYEECNGGLESAIEALGESNETVWVSWPGSVVDAASREGTKRKLISEFNCVPVFLSDETANAFHKVYCRQVLWPILHSVLAHVDILNIVSMHDAQAAYVEANERFLDVVSNVYAEGDVVLVYDFHLMLLPSLLRRRYPDIKCAFFSNCPFPSYEYWRILPGREDLLRGVLGANLVAFNHYDYLTHFTETCTCILGLPSTPRVVEYQGRVVMLGYQPLAIEASKYGPDKEMLPTARELQERYKGKYVVVSNDVLDTVAGIPQKLAALQVFFETFPEWLGKVVLCLVVTDTFSKSMASIRKLSSEVNQLVGAVNGRFGDVCYTPVHFLKNSMSEKELSVLYGIADVGLVTSLCAGISVSAFEYIACQHPNNPGVLVYSEFAGAAGLLKGSILVNPYNTFDIAVSIHRALTMSLRKKLLRYRKLLNTVNTYRPSTWSNRIFSLLRHACIRTVELNQTPKLAVNVLANEYSRARKRLILLDFRGTITDFQPIPQLNKPSERLLTVLEQLSREPETDIYILSGISCDALAPFFGHLDVGLVAEQGYFIKKLGKDVETEQDTKEEEPKVEWEKVQEEVQLLPWKQDIVEVLKYFSERTPGSFLEVSESCVMWHFQDTDKQFGLVQAMMLQVQLDQMLASQPAKAVFVIEKRYLLVHSTAVYKGRAVKQILNYHHVRCGSNYDMILAIGDDRSDETMFKQLLSLNMSNTWTCVVDQRVSSAQYSIESPEKVIELLETLGSSKQP